MLHGTEYFEVRRHAWRRARATLLVRSWFGYKAHASCIMHIGPWSAAMVQHTHKQICSCTLRGEVILVDSTASLSPIFYKAISTIQHPWGDHAWAEAA